ncbi:asparaginase [Desulfogranum marinum]|uniref:asparaginase n=1 Tax=Desulfogranum marinum TaxID=453220 RepID=UPI0019643044|nr:asparaginase [Desulfogranum marinum]MBM9514942.1 asparaginase [Desulfogranum marinum]
MSEALLEITRGDVIECIHRGDIAVVNSCGELLHSCGDPYKLTYFRSAAKPIQALHVFTSGAADRFNISDKEIAVICSSHYAEEFHRQTIRSILAKIGLTEENILGGTVTSLNSDYALQLAREGVPLSPIFSDCSGKHSGMLAACVHKGYNLTSYLSPEHPCQQHILTILADVCDVPSEDIKIGIDGCSAPVHALPIRNMALGFARLANQQCLPSTLAPYAGKIFSAMNSYPEMVSGTGGFCTELIKHTQGLLIGKIGAEGVYCVGIKGMDVGIAVKVENGSMDVLPPIVMDILDKLGCLDEEMKGKLAAFTHKSNVNDINTVVGEYRSVLQLKAAG